MAIGLILILITCIFLGYYQYSNRYDFAHELVTGRSQSSFFDVSKLIESKNVAPEVFSSQGLKIEEYPLGTLYSNIENKWRDFYFKYFKMSLPVSLGQTEIIPILIDPENENRELFSPGFKFLNSKGEFIFEMYPRPPFVFRKELSKQAIFKLPSFKKWVFKTEVDKLLPLMFLKKLEINENSSLEEVIETFFISHLRSIFLPKEFKSFEYITKKNVGVFVLSDKEYKSNVDSENYPWERRVAFLAQERTIFPWVFRMKKGDLDARTIFKLAFAGLDIQKNSSTLKDILLKEYQNLNLNNRRNKYVNFLLLSAWSFEKSNKSFLKTMIQSAERDGASLSFLGPIYDLAFRRYGDNFSSIEDRRLISKENVLEQQIQAEELDNRSKKSSNVQINASPEDILNEKLKNSETEVKSSDDILYTD